MQIQVESQGYLSFSAGGPWREERAFDLVRSSSISYSYPTGLNEESMYLFRMEKFTENSPRIKPVLR